MRLVTFTDGSGFERAGALLENDQIVLDLQAACRELQGHERAELASVLALVEAGEDGLALARSLVERVPAQAVRERALVKLRAPIQPPPQMRDCSCFELHLRQSFAAARRARALRTPDPEVTLKAMSTRADERVIETFNRQPKTVFPGDTVELRAHCACFIEQRQLYTKLFQPFFAAADTLENQPAWCATTDRFDLGGDVRQYAALSWDVEFVDHAINGIQHAA